MVDLHAPATEATLFITANSIQHKIGFLAPETGLKQAQSLMIRATQDELIRVETEIAMLEKPSDGRVV